MRREQIRAKCSGLKRCEPWRGSGKRDVRRGFPLKHLPHENEFAAFVAVADAIPDHAFADHRSEFRREVAHLVRMRKQNQFRLGACDHLFQRDAKTICRVRFEQVVLNFQNFGDIFRGEFVRKCRHTLTNHKRGHGARGVFRDLLRRRQRLETCVVPLRLPEFSDDKYFHG